LSSLHSIQANRGRALEDLLEMVFESAGPRVKMFRQNNKWVPLRNGGRFPAKGAPVDFVGTIAGMPVAVEAKEVASGHRFPLNEQRMPQKELDALLRFTAAGGAAFIVVAFWSMDILAVWPAEAIVDYRDRMARKSLTPEDTRTALFVHNLRLLPKTLVAYYDRQANYP